MLRREDLPCAAPGGDGGAGQELPHNSFWPSHGPGWGPGTPSDRSKVWGPGCHPLNSRQSHGPGSSLRRCYSPDLGDGTRPCPEPPPDLEFTRWREGSHRPAPAFLICHLLPVALGGSGPLRAETSRNPLPQTHGRWGCSRPLRDSLVCVPASCTPWGVTVPWAGSAQRAADGPRGGRDLAQAKPMAASGPRSWGARPASVSLWKQNWVARGPSGPAVCGHGEQQAPCICLRP